jgi:hypothetical protein
MNNETAAACGMLAAAVIIVDPAAPAPACARFFSENTCS